MQLKNPVSEVFNRFSFKTDLFPVVETFPRRGWPSSLCHVMFAYGWPNAMHVMYAFELILLNCLAGVSDVIFGFAARQSTESK